MVRRCVEEVCVAPFYRCARVRPWRRGRVERDGLQGDVHMNKVRAACACVAVTIGVPAKASED